MFILCFIRGNVFLNKILNDEVKGKKNELIVFLKFFLKYGK